MAMTTVLLLMLVVVAVMHVLGRSLEKFIHARQGSHEAELRWGSDRCPLCADGADHRLFVTSPPGWGSVVECPGRVREDTVVVTDEDQLVLLRSQKP